VLAFFMAVLISEQVRLMTAGGESLTNAGGIV
jgi:hypothetical protein